MTKCVNLRYMARIGEHHVVGRIGFDEDGTIVLLHNGLKPWRGNSLEEMKIYGMENFELVPRDPETYTDWQVGDKVFEEEHRNACYEVIFRSGELVIFKDWNNWASNPMTCSEAFTRFGMRLVLTDIERQIIEEKKRYEPQDGDIVTWKDEEDDGDPAISIFRRENHAYFTLFVNGKTGYSDWSLAMNIIRPATDEEKQLLFDTMAKEGKRWNAEKKVVEDIPKPYEFKKGEPVLVRTDNGKVWVIRSFLTSNPDLPLYETSDEVFMATWRHCLPYNERTMHLLGTSEDYKEGE